MKKHLKLLSLAAALCGAVACSSSDNGTTSGTPGSTGTSGGNGTSGGVTGTAAGATGTAAGATGTAAGGNGTSGGTTGTSSGGTGTGGVQPTTYPCVDGGNAYQPTNPPSGVTSCWCNPGIGIGDPTDAGVQIVNSCPQHGATADNNIPLPPPAGNESLPLYDGGGFPRPPPGS